MSTIPFCPTRMPQTAIYSTIAWPLPYDKNKIAQIADFSGLCKLYIICPLCEIDIILTLCQVIMSTDYVKALCQDIMSSDPGPPGIGPGVICSTIRAVAIRPPNFLENAPTKKIGLVFENSNQKKLFHLYALSENGRQNLENAPIKKRSIYTRRGFFATRILQQPPGLHIGNQIDLLICIYDKLWYSSQRPFSLVVRTPASQVGNSGSNPLRVTFLSSSKRVKARCQ